MPAEASLLPQLSEEVLMTITVEAIYENGVLKPNQPLPLKDLDRVQVTIHSPAPDVVQAYGIMGWKGDAETLRRIALDAEFLPEEDA
jgi:predicted DNA-binding antitoxin AbrB/MazE fold protein